MLKELRPALALLLLFTLLTGVIYPFVDNGDRVGPVSLSGSRQPDRARWQGDRIGADRPVLHRGAILPGPTVRNRRRRSGRPVQDDRCTL